MCGQSQRLVIIQAAAPVIGPYMSRPWPRSTTSRARRSAGSRQPPGVGRATRCTHRAATTLGTAGFAASPSESLPVLLAAERRQVEKGPTPSASTPRFT